MEIIGKSCLMCHKHEGLYKEDNTSVVDQLKLIYGTRNVRLQQKIFFVINFGFTLIRCVMR